jgi:nitric oxide reductase activation protein
VQEEVSEERNPGQGSDSQAVEETPPADDGNPTGPGKDTPCTASPQSAIEQALESQEETGDFGQQLRDLAHDKEPAGAFNKIQVGRAATPSELQSAGYQLQPVKASTQLVANLSSRLRGLLQAEGLKQSTPCVSGNRIARQRLHRIRAGDPKLFLKKNPEKMVNTAVHLLVDNSGSMDDNGRFHTAREVVLALVKALEVISRVNLAVSLFPAYYPYSNGTGSRQVPVAAVLPHGQLPGSKIRYPPEPEGQTPLDAAVRYAASTMLNVTEPRRIMLILTDGEPDSAWTAEVAIQEAGALGIEVVCLGIETIVCPEIFPRHEVVRSVQDLPEKTFKLLEHMLCS